MQDKLQELTDRLYKEGLSKGKQEADALLAEARKQAADIVAEAKNEAEKIIGEARRESDELRVKAEGDIKMSASQTLSAIKEKIENVIEAKSIKDPVADSLDDTAFLQSLIKTVVESFRPDENAKPLEMVLPQAMKEKMEDFLKNGISKECSSGLEVSFDRDLGHGFKISRKDSGFFIDFSGDSFGKIISQYLRPKTRKLLFGE